MRIARFHARLKQSALLLSLDPEIAVSRGSLWHGTSEITKLSELEAGHQAQPQTSTHPALVHRIAAFAFAMAIPRCQWRHRCAVTLGKFLVALYNKPLWRKKNWKQRRKGDVREVKIITGDAWSYSVSRRSLGPLGPGVSSRPNKLVIFFSLTEAPLPDPTPTPPNTPKRTRNGPETEPNGAKRTRTEPNGARNGPKSSPLGWDSRGGFVGMAGGGGS